MNATKCQHAETIDLPDSVRCFCGSVAVEPYTSENRAAHGNVTYIEECRACGAQRAVNQNQRHIEVGPYGPSLAEREAAEQAQRAAQRKTRAAADLAAVKAEGMIPLQKTVDQVFVEYNGTKRWMWIDDIQAAARQPDNGDGLVPVYRGLLALTSQLAESR